jgi:Rod binding domain-containing protein
MALMQYNSSNATTKIKNSNQISDDKLLKEQTDNFESILIKQLLDDSLKAENSLFPKQAGADIYQSMYNDAISKEVSGGFGFSKMLFDFLKDNR